MKRIIIMVVWLLIAAGCVTTDVLSGATAGLKDANKQIGAAAKSRAAEEKSILRVIQAQFEACEAEDVAGVMATLHPDMPARDAVIASLAWAYANTEGLKYELLEHVYLGNGVITFKQCTTGRPGDAFRGNILETTASFRKDGSRWKLYNGSTTVITYLDTLEAADSK